MAVVKGFRGILYNPKKAGDLSELVAPPYDVIDKKEQKNLYEKHPLNSIRLILSKEPGEKRYRSAADTLKKWLGEKILQRDKKPAIYRYCQDFELNGEIFKRKGFIAIVKIEDFESGVILPHEKTFEKYKEDRLSLIRACNSNLSQIFAVYSDPEGEVEAAVEKASGEPFAQIEFKGVKNTVWRVNCKETLLKISTLMADKKLLIADGHHRYETSINYRNIRRRDDGGDRDKPYEYIMMYLCGAEGGGLVVEPTHRVVKNLGGMSGGEVASILRKEFDCSETEPQNPPDLLRDQVVFVYDKGEKALVFSQKNKSGDHKAMGAFMLRDMVIKKIIGSETEIVFTKSHSDLMELVGTGKCEAGFIMPRPLITDIMDASEKGVRMPQKTTYFYPKILSGIVINPLWD